MQRITWCALLAVVALAIPISGQRQAQQPQLPRANVRELATIEGQVWEWILLPSRRTLIYVSQTPASTDATRSTFAYDIPTKRRTLLGTNMVPSGVSPQGDRFAFSRTAEDGTGDFLWTMPIDPKTGLATGQAQRVSLQPATRAQFSPDGKTLAFNGKAGLTLVPATGGTERVVSNYRGQHGWSADGKSLYVKRGSDDFAPGIDRVPAAGGPAEPVFAQPLIAGGQPMGLSPDGRVAFTHANPDRFFYQTASGASGEVSVALPPPLDEGDMLNMRFDSARFTAMTQTASFGVRVRDLTTGRERDLLPPNVSSVAPAWSPDGRRLAVLTGNRSHYDITVVNADGSSPRRFRVPMHLDGWFGPSPDRLAWEQPWSPDGRLLAFRANRAVDADKVGYSPYDQSQLAILDVNSGQTRVLTTSATRLGRFVWRQDGNAIRILTGVGANFSSPPDLEQFGITIVEIPLNGPTRLLREISAEFPRAADIVFIADRTAVVTVATDNGRERFLVPLDDGAARRLPDPGAEPGARIGGSGLAAGTQLLLGQVDAKGESRTIKILSTIGEATRTLRLPFANSYSTVFPDGKQIASIGKATGDSGFKLFLVPLDGSAPRPVGDATYSTWIRESAGRLLAPSPDGKRLAYVFDRQRYTSKIFEVDLNPALQTIMKR